MIIEGIEIPFEALAGKTPRLLRGNIRGWADVQLAESTPGRILWKLSQRQLGEFGTVALEKNPDERKTDVIVEYAPLGYDTKTGSFEINKQRMAHLHEVVDVFLRKLDDEGVWPKKNKKPNSFVNNNNGRPVVKAHDWAYLALKSGKDKKYIYTEWKKRYKAQKEAEGENPIYSDLPDIYRAAMNYRKRREEK